MSKISVVINTLNEEKNLPHALESVKNLADEIVVVDMHSDDATQQIAKKYGAVVYEHTRTNYVEPARNFAIEKAKGDWILILDADEEIPVRLAEKIKEVANNSKSGDYYRIPRKNIVWGKWVKHSRWWPDYNIRLFKKGMVAWSEVIHSVPMTKGTGSNFQQEERYAIFHNHYPTIELFLERMNRYTTEEAKTLVKDGYKFKWTDIIRKPTDEFLSRYFYGEGYKDGIHGLALALLQTFSELTKYLKVWQSGKFKEINPSLEEIVGQINKSKKDLNYWQADALVKNKGGIMQIIKRKFRLP